MGWLSVIAPCNDPFCCLSVLPHGSGGGGGSSEGDFGIMARITSFIVNAKYLFVVVKTWTVTACSKTAFLRLSSFFTFSRRATF